MQTIVYVLLLLSVFFDAKYQGERNWLAEKNDDAKTSKKYWFWWKKDKVIFLIMYLFYIVSICALSRNIYDVYGQTYADVNYYMLKYLNISSVSIAIGIEALVMYGVMRFVLFDYIHNFFMKNHVMYIGVTSEIDKALRRISKIFPPSFLMMLRIFIFAVMTYYHYSVVV